jgi:uncharacterized protein (TIGR03067 family)
LAVLGVLIAGLSARGEPPAEVKKELERLQGKWEFVSLVYNGKDFFADGKARFDFVIKGDHVTVEGNDAVRKEYATLRLKPDPQTTPHCLDIVVTGGAQKDAVIEGIYELKGDELRICAKIGAKERPTEFASPEGASIVLAVLKKAKP